MKILKNVFSKIGVSLNILWAVIGIFNFISFFSMNRPSPIHIIVVLFYFIGLIFSDIIFPIKLLHLEQKKRNYKIIFTAVLVIWIVSVVCSGLWIFVSPFGKYILFNKYSYLDKIWVVFLAGIPNQGLLFLFLGNIFNIFGAVIYLTKKNAVSKGQGLQDDKTD